MIKIVKNNRLRQSIRIIFAICIALGINYFFVKPPTFLLPLATFFVMLTPPGNAFYKGVLRFLFLTCIVFLILILFLPALSIKPALYAIGIGSIIGIALNISVLPDQADVLFRESMITILEAYTHYFQSIIYLMLFQSSKKIEKNKAQVEQAFSRLPVWVFNKGFDQSMQKGYQYFFIKINELSEILFTMHHLARFSYDKRVLAELQKPFIRCSKKIEHFLDAIVDILKLKKNKRVISDFSEDIKKIEKKFKKLVPIASELIDIDKEYVYLIEFLYTLHALHDNLIKLAVTLR